MFRVEGLWLLLVPWLNKGLQVLELGLPGFRL